VKDIREHDFYNDGDYEESGLSAWECIALLMAAQAAALGVIEWILR